MTLICNTSLEMFNGIMKY